jgi:hypothetical protein
MCVCESKLESGVPRHAQKGAELFGNGNETAKLASIKRGSDLIRGPD